MPISSRNLRCRKPKRKAYVLIMTLVLIVIAALASVGLARRSLIAAQEAAEAQASLQRHWGTHSCRTVLLDNAAELFQQLEDKHLEADRPWPAPAIVFAEIPLGGVTHRLWLTDENAKLNLNTLTTRLPDKRRQVLFDLVRNSAILHLQPDNSPEAKRRKRSFSSWGQVVPLAKVWESGSSESLVNSLREITCWGNGKINIRRASAQLLERVIREVLSQDAARELIAARSQSSNAQLDEILVLLDLRRRQEITLKWWLTDESSCFGLWQELEDRDRRWYYQGILGDSASIGQDSVVTFSW